jgi:6-phosphofructokinase 1
MKIGILTGGGDVPGLNACIKAVVGRAAVEGHQVIGIRRGWGGLLEIDPSNPLSIGVCTEQLDPSAVRTIDR